MAEERWIGAHEFKQRCFRLLDRVALEGVTFIVTRGGRPVARIQPIGAPKDLRPTMGSVTLLSEKDEDCFATGEVWG